jgi:hypothetical protein
LPVLVSKLIFLQNWNSELKLIGVWWIFLNCYEIQTGFVDKFC